MLRNAVFFQAILIVVSSDLAVAQFDLPRVGSLLPEVSAFDEQGNEFSTGTLRGHYSVLVFGCLT